MNQLTIKKSFRVSGHGLHTGRMVTVNIQPAPSDSGILFRRTDKLSIITQPATADRVGDTSRGTSLKTGRQVIATIEHLMSALHSMQIDNVLIELDGGEVPILDGSARPWLQHLQRVGVIQQDLPKRVMTFDEPLHFEFPETGSVYDMEPSDHFSVDCVIDFAGTVIGRQEAEMHDFTSYASEIAPCRTFVFLHEIEPLLHLNLIKGGSLDNALVFVNQEPSPRLLRRLGRKLHKDPSTFRVHDGMINTTDRYFDNEPARHKLLDFVGDIRLVGLPPVAHFSIYKPGHKANTAFARFLMDYYNNKH
ncbi:MAG: UDP-3-O-acyl-N-acetylglucosamine deacetylase [Bacteroidales bacterium]|nr:UDP-3-O-acyl-N-acetylglucosamine deacetylase [Bacteroidales bacterium]